MELKKATIASVGGGAAAFLWYMVIAAALSSTKADLVGVFIIFLLAFPYFLYTRTKRAKHTAGWACVLLSLGSFAIPVSALLLSAFVASQSADQSGAAALGAGIAGTIVTGIGIVVGGFFGIAFAVAAYFLLKN